jgi:hypothetical protein
MKPDASMIGEAVILLERCRRGFVHLPLASATGRYWNRRSGALHGTAVCGEHSTGKFAGQVTNGNWTGLANGGSYFCME